MNFKDIHIGQLIKIKTAESGIELSRICKFIQLNENDILKMYESKNIDTELLLKWSKILEYDFFRLYSQHLIFYAPRASTENTTEIRHTSLPQFRKNVYTKEIIEFVLEQISGGEMSRKQVIEQYKIPKTTLYKWIKKYGK